MKKVILIAMLLIAAPALALQGARSESTREARQQYAPRVESVKSDRKFHRGRDSQLKAAIEQIRKQTALK